MAGLSPLSAASQAPTGGVGGPSLGIYSKSAAAPEIIEHFENRAAPPAVCSGGALGGAELRTRAEAAAEAVAQKEAKRAMSRRFRWWLSMRQRAEVIRAGLYQEFKSLINCHRYSVPAYVKCKDGSVVSTGSPERPQIHSYEKDENGVTGLGLAWVRKCCNSLLCFLDAPKIHAIRQEEVNEVCKRMYALGYRWALVTLTASHNMNTDPVKFVDKFQDTVKFFYSGRPFGRIKKKWNYGYTIRANECTDDSPDSKKKSGIHWHMHGIFFFKRDNDFSDDEKVELTKDLQNQWVYSLIHEGLCSEDKREDLLKHACQVSIKDSTTIEVDVKTASEYLAKKTAVEIAPSITLKRGRLPDRITHWELMTLAFTTRPELIPRALLIMQALKGRTWIFFGGTKKLVNFNEITDDEILREKKGEVVYDFTNEEKYIHIDDLRMQYDIIYAAQLISKEENVSIEFAVCSSIEIVLSGFNPLTGEKLDRKKPPE